MRKLRQIDQVAYVRFASVYHDFKDVHEFIDEVQEVRDLSGGEWEWTEGMLYPVLHRLQREGLIQSRWAVSQQGRRRRYYRLRRDGTRALKEESRQWMLANSMIARLLEPKPCST